MDAVNHLQLTVSPSQVKPTLRALLFAIFFHRLLDAVEPDTYEIQETHVACAPTPALEKEVSAKLEDFGREYLERGAERGEIAIVFLQKKPKKGWFAISEELVPWEEHLITLSFPRRLKSSPPPNPLPEALLQILGWCAEKAGNVPPLQGSETTLSHQILIAPPPPSELFAPSPPLPARSPPPMPTTSTTPALALAKAHDRLPPPGTPRDALPDAATTSARAASYARRDSSPASLPAQAASAIGNAAGYLGSVKDGVRAVAGWGGRGTGRQ